MFHHRFITRLWWLMQTPERQTGEEDEGRPDTVIPFRLVYLYFHRSEVFRDFGILKVIHLIDHANSRVNDGIGTEGACPLAEP